MKAIDAVLLWKSGSPDDVVVIPHLSDSAWDYRDWSSTLAPWTGYRETDDLNRLVFIFIEAMQLIIRDKMNPQAVHVALLNIDEYRAALAPDVPGAIPGDWFTLPRFGLGNASD